MTNNLSQAIDLKKILAYCSLTFLLLLIPLKISSYGNIPPDDAMRHAAYAVDNRMWGEVLVLRETILDSVDSHPGWHSYLRWLHKTVGLDTEGLVIASFVTTFFTFGCVGLFSNRKPLVWVTALLILYLLDGGVLMRILLGRPFAISMAVALAILFLWQRQERLAKTSEYIVTSLMLALAIWLHPSWYLWLIFPAAFVLSGRWGDALRFGTCLLIALVVAVILAASYYNIVFYPVHHLLISMTQDPLRRLHLVSEFQPGGGSLMVVIVVVTTLAIYAARGRDWRTFVFRVDFCLMLTGWIAGLYVTRFWSDWGSVGFVAWACWVLHTLNFQAEMKLQHKIIAAGMACLSFLLLTSSDAGGRYSNSVKDSVLSANVDELRKVLPDKGGILYGTDMSFFYRTYYRLPNAGFRYIIGFEPGMMRSADWAALRQIQLNDGFIASYDPWLLKLTTADRIEIGSSPIKPEIKGFSFEFAAGKWIGKKLIKQAAASNSGL